MSGIKQPISDILSKLSMIQVKNQDNQTVGLFSRIWNNQIRDLREGKDYVWPRPAAFVEIISPVRFEIAGIGFRNADLGFRIHLVHDFYNNDGTYEQDLSIYDLRDKILANFDNPINPGLSGYCPTACGPLNCISEESDSDHDNLVVYVLDFVCNFMDSKASPFDPDAGKYVEEITPGLDLEVVKDGIPAKETKETYILPTKQY